MWWFFIGYVITWTTQALLFLWNWGSLQVMWAFKETRRNFWATLNSMQHTGLLLYRLSAVQTIKWKDKKKMKIYLHHLSTHFDSNWIAQTCSWQDWFICTGSIYWVSMHACMDYVKKKPENSHNPNRHSYCYVPAFSIHTDVLFRDTTAAPETFSAKY